MGTTEALSVLRAALEPYRARSHAELQELLRAPVATQIPGPSGKRYQVLIQAAWVSEPGGPLRVVGGVADSGWQRFTPLVESFVVIPEPARAPRATPQRDASARTA
jgi:hypothetical protein